MFVKVGEYRFNANRIVSVQEYPSGDCDILFAGLEPSQGRVDGRLVDTTRPHTIFLKKDEAQVFLAWFDARAKKLSA